MKRPFPGERSYESVGSDQSLAVSADQVRGQNDLCDIPRQEREHAEKHGSPESVSGQEHEPCQSHRIAGCRTKYCAKEHVLEREAELFTDKADDECHDCKADDESAGWSRNDGNYCADMELSMAYPPRL